MNIPVRQTIFYFISWRTATIILTLVISNLFTIENADKPLQLWANWDGGHYIGIAVNGYVKNYQFAFFPFYPILIKTLTFLHINQYLAALLISNCACIAALYFLLKLAPYYQIAQKTGLNTLLVILAFPTAFFFTAAYTESLLLLFTVTSLYFAKKGNWFLASILAFFATFTKFIGVATVLLLIIEYIIQIKKESFSSNKIMPLIYISLFGLSGLYLYGYYLFFLTENPFYFQQVQSHWGRSTSIANPLEILWITEQYIFSNQTFLSIQSFEVHLIIIVLLLLPVIYKKLGINLALYTLVITTFTLFSGKTESTLRYILTAFPFFWILTGLLEKKRIIFYLYLLLSILLQFHFLRLFLSNNWVA